MKTFADTIGLRVPGLSPAVVDVLYRQIQLVLVVLALSAVFRTAIGEHTQQRDLLFLEEGQHLVIEQIGRHQRILAVVEFGKGDFGVGIEEEAVTMPASRSPLSGY
jgi:hypothetical protein